MLGDENKKNTSDPEKEEQQEEIALESVFKIGQNLMKDVKKNFEVK